MASDVFMDPASRHAVSSAPASADGHVAPPRPWWKEPYVWMVIAGPVSAVLACAVTAVYIWQGPDAVVSENYYREGMALEKEAQSARPAMQPAKVGRNHSATGGKQDAAP